MIPHFKIQITEIPLEKSSIPLQYCKSSCPPPYCQRGDRKFGLKTSNYIWCLQSLSILSQQQTFIFQCWCRRTCAGISKQIYRSKKRPFSQGFSIKECDWVQQKIISYSNFPAQEFECMVCCPMLCDKLCVVHWLLSKYHKYYCGNKLWSIL